jgi:two-component system phosphate regulon response regulator PhoB
VKKILVVDKDADLLDIIDYVVIQLGYKLVAYEAELNAEAIVALNPSLIILDNLYPGGIGVDLCRELKGSELTKHIPILLFSVHGHLEEKTKELCADAWLEKPFDMQELEKIIERLAL